MTRLGEVAFQKFRALPDDEQDRYAQWLIDEIESERKWDELFVGSQDVLERLAEDAEEDIRAGRVADLTEADFDL